MHNILIIETIWKMSLQAGLMILLVLLCSFLLRRRSKKYSYALWMLVILRLLIPVFVESPVAVNGIVTGKFRQMEQHIYAGQNTLPMEKWSDKRRADGNQNADDAEDAQNAKELRKQSRDNRLTEIDQSESNGLILAEPSKEDASDLLLYYDSIFTEEFMGQIPHWADDGLWANWQGISLGNGNAWFEVKKEEWMIRALMDEENGLEVRPVTSSKQ